MKFHKYFFFFFFLYAFYHQKSLSTIAKTSRLFQTRKFWNVISAIRKRKKMLITFLSFINFKAKIWNLMIHAFEMIITLSWCFVRCHRFEKHAQLRILIVLQKLWIDFAWPQKSNISWATFEIICGLYLQKHSESSELFITLRDNQRFKFGLVIWQTTTLEMESVYK